MSGNAGFEFAAYVHRLLTGGDGMRITDVAEATGLSYDVLYSRLSQRVHFRPAEIRRLFLAMKDPRLLDYFVEDSEHMIVRRMDAGCPVETVQEGTLQGTIRMGDIARAIQKALEDQRIDHRDKAAILTEVKEAEEALASLRAYLEQ
ncbi:phage regulatory CII family protein [Yunchengibacter salinarum]|uniref:phage regulatory CII family protein n=1 Tax=Yunchengibacter salinarum TaxID=3133399 RepID=UPI0035B5940D